MRQLIAKKWKKLNPRFKIIAIPFLLVGLATAASLVFAYGQNDNKTGLVLDIDFSQDNYNTGTRTFTDKSGNGNNAISTNQATFTNGKNGESNGAMQFTNTNDEVIIPNNSSYKTNSITVSFLYKPHNIGKRHVIFTSWTGFTTEINSDRTFKWGLYGPSGQYFGTKKINWDEWVYITGTFDNTSKQQCIYFNGVKQECQTVTGSINYGTGHLYLSGPWDWISGEFESVKIYDHALSESEIKDLYNNTKPKTQVSSLEKGLIAYFPMNGENFNTSNNKLTDNSAYSNHANNSGGILTTDRFEKSNGAINFGNSTAREYTSSYIPSASYNLTMSAWIKPSAYPSERGTIILGSGAYYLSLYNDGSIHTYWYGRNPSGYHSSLTGKAPIGEWTQVAAVWRDNSVDLYVNGALTNTVAVNNAPGNNSNSLILGAESSGRQYKGAMSDVRVYNRALSNEEIEQLYTNYKPKTSASSLNKGLVLDMPLTSKYTKSNTVGSEILTDLTPYSNDGQNIGTIINSDSTNFQSDANYYIRSINNIYLNSSQTYSVWVRPTTFGSLRGIFTTHDHATTANIGINQTNDHFNISIGYADGTREYSLKPSAYIITPNIWTHVVLLYDAIDNSVSFYINGNFDNKWILTKTVKFIPQKILFGQWSNNYLNTQYKFNGDISNAKMYQRALSASEIKSLYDQGRGRNGAILNGLQ